MDSNTNTNQTTHLQGIGRVPAIPANDLRVGDTIIYNYGSRSVVCGITARGKSQIIVHTAAVGRRSGQPGGFYTSVISRTRLVAVAR